MTRENQPVDNPVALLPDPRFTTERLMSQVKERRLRYWSTRKVEMMSIGLSGLDTPKLKASPFSKIL
jgi:hypothetical protein